MITINLTNILYLSIKTATCVKKDMFGGALRVREVRAFYI